MSDSKSLCCFCRLPRAENKCGLCSDDVCRRCAERISEDAFSFLSSRPVELTHSHYCPRCFETTVAPQMAEYESMMERARNVGYWARTYRGHIPVIKKAQRWVEVSGLRDEKETLLRLAFMAVEQGYNGLVQGELVGRKNRENGYQRTIWNGKATPCKIDVEKLERADHNEAVFRSLPHR